MAAVRRLRKGDESILASLAREDSEFDLEGRSPAMRPLSRRAARAFLADPNVLLWIESRRGMVTGFLYCCVVRLRGEAPRELLLYEIGVRREYRRQGVGKGLLAAMERWMRAQRIDEVWVLADNRIAVKFYRACGFRVEKDVPVYMTRRVR
ncbi:MAG TPA: GNAT family N-acetyltransferase [Myxococcaceae bacterium]|nr:GNAT family N-acetyltransferase [Myxococcaceae bacterium]